MKLLLWSLIAGLASSASSGALAAATGVAEEEKDEAKQVTQWVTADGQVIVLDDEGSDGQTHFVFKAAGDDDQGAVRHLVVTGTGSGVSDGSGQAFFISESGDRTPLNLTAVGEEIDENAGWLGVQIGLPQPAEEGAVAPEGIVILNVIEGSPAESAGFQKGDLVTEVDDVDVGSDLEGFVHTIRDAGVDARVKFTVLRDGERRTLATTLASRTEMKPLNWVFETSPQAIMKDSLRTRAKVLLRGEDGELLFGDLSKIDDLPELPARILELMPKSEGKTVQVFVNDGGTTITTEVTTDGQTVAVERTGDGEITVTRSSDETGEQSVEQYADEDALAAGDPEAYEVYKNTSSNVIIGVGEDMPTFSFDVDLEDIDTQVEDALRNLNVEIKSLDDLHEHLGALHDLDIKIGGDGDDVLHRMLLGTRKASRSIHENADGSIDVIIRKGDNELVTHYLDLDDLAERSPDDYDAYLELQSAEERE
jgi:hypothetical protein